MLRPGQEERSEEPDEGLVKDGTSSFQVKQGYGQTKVDDNKNTIIYAPTEPV